MGPRGLGAFGTQAAGGGKNVRFRSTVHAARITWVLMPILPTGTRGIHRRGLRIVGRELGPSEGARPVPLTGLTLRVESNLKTQVGPLGQHLLEILQILSHEAFAAAQLDPEIYRVGRSVLAQFVATRPAATDLNIRVIILALEDNLLLLPANTSIAT